MARFDEDTYARARKFVESGGSEEPKKTFKQAFAEARKAGDSTFTWNGKKYSTEVASERSKDSPAVPGRPRGESVAESKPRRGEPVSGSALLSRFGTEEARKSAPKIEKYEEPTKEDIAAAQERIAAKRKRFDEGEFAGLTTLKRIGARMGTESMRKKLSEEGYKKGGAVKKYAKGGSVRGNGCAQRGKTRGTMR